MMQHSFADGKYTITNDNGKLTALRNGEPWGRDLTGDNLIYWMLVEVDKLKSQRDVLFKALDDATDWMESLRQSGDAGNWEWEDDEYTQAIAALNEARGQA